MITSDPTATEPRSAFRCDECGSGLAHDQRYCTECGTRRGPLPPEIAGLIGAIHEQGPEPDLPEGTPLADSLSEDRDPPPAPPFGFAMPGPRAAAPFRHSYGEATMHLIHNQVKRPRPTPLPDLDLRTPSGRQLPY